MAMPIVTGPQFYAGRWSQKLEGSILKPKSLIFVVFWRGIVDSVCVGQNLAEHRGQEEKEEEDQGTK